jgi:peptidyl-prolyl cis-trans isomerase SurA
MKAWLILLTVAGLLARDAQAQRPWRDWIAALVNDTIITFKEIEDHAAPGIEVLQRTYFSQPEVLEQKTLETLTRGLEDLVQKQLILDDFKTQGGALPEAIIDDEVRDRIRQKFAGDRATFTRTLQAQGVTLELFRQRIRDEMIVGYMRQKNISQALIISPTKIEQFYATNLAQFQVGEQVELRMIVIKAAESAAAKWKLAAEILRKLEEGASFAEMAAIHSEGSQQTAKGYWGWQQRSELNRGLGDVAFSLKVGSISGILGRAPDPNEGYWIYLYDKEGRITTARRYTLAGKEALAEERKFDANTKPENLPEATEFYIERLEAQRPARVRPLEEVRDIIDKELLAQERARLQGKWIDRLKAKAFVRYF